MITPMYKPFNFERVHARRSASRGLRKTYPSNLESGMDEPSYDCMEAGSYSSERLDELERNLERIEEGHEKGKVELEKIKVNVEFLERIYRR